MSPAIRLGFFLISMFLVFVIGMNLFDQSPKAHSKSATVTAMP